MGIIYDFAGKCKGFLKGASPPRRICRAALGTAGELDLPYGKLSAQGGRGRQSAVPTAWRADIVPFMGIARAAGDTAGRCGHRPLLGIRER